MFKTKSLEHYFKPEVRNRGEDYYDEDAVYLSKSTDTEIAGIIKASPPVRITLSAKSIADKVFSVACSCSSSQKGQLCKHIWGTILTASLDYPDFFDSKTDLLKANASTKSNSSTQSDFQEKLKTKQSTYRKEQYQKLKNEKKAKTGKVSKTQHRPVYNDAAEEAIKYFSENGFEISHPINLDTLKSAKKILSRVFHPDKGGSHEEALELNKHFDTLAALA